MAEERKRTRKPAAKKAPAKRPAAKKAPAKKPAAKKAPAKKPAKRTTKATAASKASTAKKPAAKTTAAKKPAPKTKPATTRGAKSTTAKRLEEASAKLRTSESSPSAAPRKRAANRPPVNLQPIASSGAGPSGQAEGKEGSSTAPGSNGKSSKSNGKGPGSGRPSRSGGRRKTMPPAHEITAPSIGPHTQIEYIPPEERLAGHDIPQTDAMGHDKRRQVVGGSYGPSLTKQASLYGIFIAVIAALVVGGIILVNELDRPPDEYADAAPWQDSQQKPARIDFPRSSSQPAVPVD